jgi:hypothetical protein
MSAPLAFLFPRLYRRYRRPLKKIVNVARGTLSRSLMQSCKYHLSPLESTVTSVAENRQPRAGAPYRGPRYSSLLASRLTCRVKSATRVSESNPAALGIQSYLAQPVRRHRAVIFAHAHAHASRRCTSDWKLHASRIRSSRAAMLAKRNAFAFSATVTRRSLRDRGPLHLHKYPRAIAPPEAGWQGGREGGREGGSV